MTKEEDSTRLAELLSRPPNLDNYFYVDNVINWYYLGKEDIEYSKFYSHKANLNHEM